jgi:hypothetical protein
MRLQQVLRHRNDQTKNVQTQIHDDQIRSPRNPPRQQSRPVQRTPQLLRTPILP